MFTLIKETTFDFMGNRRKSFALSLAIIVIGVGSMVVRGGLRMGVDFTGGAQIEVGIKADAGTSIDIAAVRRAVEAAGYDNRNIQRVGGRDENNFLIHVRAESASPQATGSEASADAGRDASEQILTAMRAEFGQDNVDLRAVESVGPKIGAELRGAAIQAVLLSLLLVAAYVWWRFEFRFAVATLVGLLHNVVVVVGLFALFNKEMTLNVIAALLTLVGYSVNDTIVIFDRIREELKRKQRRESLAAIFNAGINRTLSRTLLTSVTTMFVLAALFFYGGEVIHDFSWVLIVGIIVGTYSSVFIAAPLVVEWEQRSAPREVSRAA